jgi:anthranilate synthase/aminodeoxychorismate synthase-like glutamine amidotransferase
VEQTPPSKLLQICAACEALGAVMGGSVIRAPRLMHGKSSDAFHDREGLYAGLSNPMQVARYHSLIVAQEDLPACLVVTSYTSEGEIMGVRHVSKPIFGTQFHPESVLTPDGDELLANFLAVEA